VQIDDTVITGETSFLRKEDEAAKRFTTRVVLVGETMFNGMLIRARYVVV
jgi:hypothetical protein